METNLLPFPVNSDHFAKRCMRCAYHAAPALLRSVRALPDRTLSVEAAGTHLGVLHHESAARTGKPRQHQLQ